jgi:hypothetical protein
VAVGFLDSGMPHEHLIAGFHLLFRKVVFLASDVTGRSIPEVMQQCAYRTATYAAEAEAAGRSLVHIHGDAGVSIDPYLAAHTVIGYFVAAQGWVGSNVIRKRARW